MKIYKKRHLAVAVCGIIALIPARKACAQLVLDGDFEGLSTLQGSAFSGSTVNGGQLNYNITMPDWTEAYASGSGATGTPGYNFIFSYAAASGSANGVFGDNGGAQSTAIQPGTTGSEILLWNSKDGGLSSIPDPYGTGSGNILGSDGGFENGAVSQIISGLTSGATYDVNFIWAASQQSYTTGPTTSGWEVDLGTSPVQTVETTNPSMGFTGWIDETMVFKATSTAEALSFLATGTPVGAPPFELLADVTMNVVPEPSTIFAGAFLMLPIGYRIARKFYKKTPPQS